MSQAVERRTREPFIAENLRPILKWQVGCHDHAVSLVGRGNHVEQQFGARFAGGDVSQLIQNQQVQLAKLLAQSQELSFVFRFQERRDQFGHTEEPDFPALSAGGHAGRRCDCGEQCRTYVF